jgi:HSP20 family protein
MKLLNVRPTNGNSAFPTVNHWLDQFFQEDLPHFSQSHAAHSAALVNTLETKEGFTIELVAPGFQKEQFEIKIEENQLSVTATKEEKKLEEGERFTRREYSINTFKRHFTLPKAVNAEAIKAEYKEGILYLSLPKIEEAKAKGAINIPIA